MLRVFFNLILDIIYEYGRFAKTLLKKIVKFVLYKKNNLVLLNLDFILLLIKVNPILKE